MMYDCCSEWRVYLHAPKKLTNFCLNLKPRHMCKNKPCRDNFVNFQTII